ncbi:cysteinyl-tRNA synthetase [Nowakowskiella sp. JEL0407]|nr:cysteinyl-tRNA synthetase [Nowakowskiella sp. JEL0407]
MAEDTDDTGSQMLQWAQQELDDKLTPSSHPPHALLRINTGTLPPLALISYSFVSEHSQVSDSSDMSLKDSSSTHPQKITSQPSFTNLFGALSASLSHSSHRDIHYDKPKVSLDSLTHAEYTQNYEIHDYLTIPNSNSRETTFSTFSSDFSHPIPQSPKARFGFPNFMKRKGVGGGGRSDASLNTNGTYSSNGTPGRFAVSSRPGSPERDFKHSHERSDGYSSDGERETGKYKVRRRVSIGIGGLFSRGNRSKNAEKDSIKNSFLNGLSANSSINFLNFPHEITIAHSSWKIPDSWGTDMISETEFTEQDIDNLPKLEDEGYFDEYNSNLYFNGTLGNQKIRRNFESLIRRTGDDMGYIRIYRQDNTFSTILCRQRSTVREILTHISKKFQLPPSDISRFRIILVKNGIERTLNLDDMPAFIQRRIFLELGYTEEDNLLVLGREDNFYLFRFVVGEVVSGNETSQKLLSNPDDVIRIDLSHKNLSAVPLFLHRCIEQTLYLNLSRNPNIKELPSDLAQTASSLLHLSMSQNELHLFPKSLQFIDTLTNLDLSCNYIRSLENCGLRHIPNLVYLNLQGNRLDHIPGEFLKESQLQELDLSNNRFRTIPPELIKHLQQSLKILNISFCRLEEISENIGSLRELLVLNLAGNKIHGEIPDSFRDLSNLIEFDARGNCFEQSSVLPALSMCANLKTVLLDGNKLTWGARKPDEFDTDGKEFISMSGFNLLKCLSLVNQEVEARLDTTLTFYFSHPLEHLTKLALAHCGIEVLPKKMLFKTPKLETLLLDGNNLKELPYFVEHGEGLDSSKIGPFHLRVLSVANNNLESLPDDIGDLMELEVLDFHSNQVREIPIDIWTCAKLHTINGTSNLLDKFQPPVSDMRPESRLSSYSDMTGGLDSDEFGNTALPPLSRSLQHLYLADNRFTEALYEALHVLPEIRVLNCAFNEISDITSWVYTHSNSGQYESVPWFHNLRELHLAGNYLSSLPGEIEQMENLKWLFLNANRLNSIPGEIAKLTKLVGIDVGSQFGSRGEGTGLRYNITNWPYDWNWNCNPELQYLNLSGNKRLEIRHHASTSNTVPQTPSTPLSPKFIRSSTPTPPHVSPYEMTDFNGLSKLRLLGLIDVTCLVVPPDESLERRVRSTGSEIPIPGLSGGIIRYGVADLIIRPPLYPSLPEVTENTISVWDLVIPRFRNKDNEALFAIFDGGKSKYGQIMAKRLSEWFSWHFATQLTKVELEEGKVNGGNPVKKSEKMVAVAIRRAFIVVNKELEMQIIKENLKSGNSGSSLCGCSAVIAYFVGSDPDDEFEEDKCSMFVSNVGDCMAVLSKAGGLAHVLSRNDLLTYGTLNQQGVVEVSKSVKIKESPGDEITQKYNINGQWDEVERIQRAGGTISSDNLLVNSRCQNTHTFGYFDEGFHHPVNADPWIQCVELDVTEDFSPKPVIDHSLFSQSSSAESIDFSGSGNTADEFMVLATSSIWRSCGKSYENAAQTIVDIARGAIVNYSNNIGQQAQISTQVQKVPSKLGLFSGVQGIMNVVTSTKSGGWGTAAMKVRDVAMSFCGMESGWGNGSADGGHLVMVLGFKELVRKTTWWSSNRRGSSETSSHHSSFEKGKERLKRVPGDTERPGEYPAVYKEIEPPTGKLALVFTDIKSSTRLWESHPNAMRQAIKIHNTALRRLLRQSSGYEVKTEGDAFMVSFKNPINALEWCLTVQTELMKLDWPQEILQLADAGEVWESGVSNGESDEDSATLTNGVRLFRGLCVRMGIHFGTPLCEADPVTTRMDYFGPMVNRASRVCNSSQGGQILASSDFVKEVRRQVYGSLGSLAEIDVMNFIDGGKDLSQEIVESGYTHMGERLEPVGGEYEKLKALAPCVWLMGEVKLKGLETPETIFAIYPKGFQGRHEFLSEFETRYVKISPPKIETDKDVSFQQNDEILPLIQIDLPNTSVLIILAERLKEIAVRLETLLQQIIPASLIKQSCENSIPNLDENSTYQEIIVSLGAMVSEIEVSDEVMQILFSNSD